MERTTRTYDRLIQFVCEQPWAILPSYLTLMRELLAMRAAGLRLSAEEIAERIEAAEARGGPSTPAPAGVAVIPVWGVIGHRANELRDISSRVGTSTEMLADQVAAAVVDPNAKAIVLDINSPGGGVYGVPEVADFIRSQRGKKPIVAVSNALAVSAAYWIASAASELVVIPSGQVGAIGVFSIHEDHSKELADAGVSVSLIRAGKFKAEDNPFGPLTEEARTAIQERVDGYFSMFTRDVARGRGVAIDAVRNGFGEGRVMNAKEAVALKMADRIGTMDDVLRGLLNGDAVGAAAASDGVCAACNGSGLKPERFMSDPQGQETCEKCGGSGKTSGNSAQFAAEEPPAPAVAVPIVDPEIDRRRLLLRLAQLG